LDQHRARSAYDARDEQLVRQRLIPTGEPGPHFVHLPPLVVIWIYAPPSGVVRMKVGGIRLRSAILDQRGPLVGSRTRPFKPCPGMNAVSGALETYGTALASNGRRDASSSVVYQLSPVLRRWGDPPANEGRDMSEHLNLGLG
jgi:hypothetical protein